MCVHVFINIHNPYMQHYFTIIQKNLTSLLYCTFSKCCPITSNFVFEDAVQYAQNRT